MKSNWSWLAGGLVVGLLAGTGRAEPAAPLQSLAKMPIREVTVFKDGHAFVLHSGRMPVDAAGNVVLDYLPAPVIGTFWPFAADKVAKLSAVTASPRKVRVERTALNLRELIEANLGNQVMVQELPAVGGREGILPPYPATILDVPAQSGEELEATSPPFTGDKLPQKGNIVLLKTEAGVKAVNVDRIQDVTFKGDFKRLLAREEFRNLLTLKLDWAGRKPAAQADVGMVYVQRGIRWIPEYRVTLDGKGNATVRLQATLLNEMADLEDVTLHLVIGVPTFLFKDTVDPVSLQQGVAQLSQYFRPDSQTAHAFSNAIMTQQVSYGARSGELRGRSGDAAPTMDLGPELTGAGKAEDLFIFDLAHVTLKKGQRQVVPVREFALKYRDVFTLDLPFAPPPEVRGNLNDERQAEIARLFAAPKAVHRIRLTNSSDVPLTTAPTLIVLGERVLAQSLMTYTAVGAASDLEVTTAVDIAVRKTDTETKRTPDATVWNGDRYSRIDLAGTIGLTNFRKEPVEIEVTRRVLGNVGEADNGGKAEMLNVFEDAGADTAYPTWWRWYSWPGWWPHFNGVGRVTWTVKLEPAKPLDLKYTWNYFWR